MKRFLARWLHHIVFAILMIGLAVVVGVIIAAVKS